MYVLKSEQTGLSLCDLRVDIMTKNPDLTEMFKDVMGKFPVDMTSFEDVVKTATSLNEKLSHVAIDAAEKSTEISSKWTQKTLSKLGHVSTSKADASDYAKAITDFASSCAEVTTEHMTAFAEVAKKAQMETVELMMAAGKDITEDASAVVKKATGDINIAAKKVSVTK